MTKKHETYLKLIQETINRIGNASQVEFEWLFERLREAEKDNKRLKTRMSEIDYQLLR